MKSFFIKSFDVILLDINLSDTLEEEWFKILKYIRSFNTNIPVVIISSYNEYTYLERAFLAWANDYLIKPFRKRELQIRIRRWFYNAILSDYYTTPQNIVYWDLVYDISNYEFYFSWKSMKLSKSSKYILSILLTHKEKLVKHSYLIEKIWWFSELDCRKKLRIRIMRLKRQLDIYKCSAWIQSVHWEGFILKKF